MKEYIQGNLIEKNIDEWIVDVSGTGWLVKVPPVYNILSEPVVESIVRVYVYENTVFAGNKITSYLFGFLHKKERDFFIQALKLPKLGPSGFIHSLTRPINEIATAIINGNLIYLKKLPGIGVTKAKGLIELMQPYLLKNKLWSQTDIGASQAIPISGIEADLLSILIQMQFSKSEALHKIAWVRKKYPEEKEPDKLLRYIFSYS